MRLESILPVVLAATLAGSAPAQGSATPTAQERAILDRIMQRLLPHIRTTPEFRARFVWPPEVELLADTPKNRKFAGKYNAFATLKIKVVDGKRYWDKDAEGRHRTYVGVTLPFLREWIGRNLNGLAFTLGHELGHLIHEHTLQRRPGDVTGSVADARKKEIEADAYGAKVAFSAGYSPKGLVAFWKVLQEKKLQYCSIRHLQRGGHPSWDDRFALVDPRRSKVWQSLSAFRNGVFLLNCGHYAPAAQCFERVVEEFDNAAAARANLGYALLLQFMDGLKREDLESLAVGHVVPMGAYVRAKELEARLRAPDTALWTKAVAELRGALQANDQLALAAANLGVALLLDPTGKADQKEAASRLGDARRLAAAQRLGAKTQAAIQVNLAVVALRASDAPAALKHLDAADRLFEADRKAQRAWVDASFKERANEIWPRVQRKLESHWHDVRAAVAYNGAMAGEVNKDTKGAIDRWTAYLQATPPDSVWWRIAEGRAKKLSPALEVTTRTEEKARRVLAVAIAGKGQLTLAEPVAEVERRVGRGTRLPITGRGSLHRLHYSDLGIELIADRQVLAIRLLSEESPPVVIKSSSLGAEGTELRVGMRSAVAFGLLAKYGRPYSVDLLPDRRYAYFPAVGVAIRFSADANGPVQELAIVHVPQRRRR